MLLPIINNSLRLDWTGEADYNLLNAAIVNPDNTEELALTWEGKKKKLKGEYF